MVDIRTHALADIAGTWSPAAIEPLTGLRPFVSQPAVEAVRAQDRIPAQSWRTLLAWGLRGDTEWRVPNTSAQNASRTHPDRTTWYTVARARVDISPGSFLVVSGTCVPSGMTQTSVTSGSPALYQPDGVHGAIRVTVVWHPRSGVSATTVHEISLPQSTLDNGSEDTSAGGLWRSLQEFGPLSITPPGVPENPSELARFSRAVTATITVEHQGSPRIVDATVDEVPLAIALDLDSAGDNTYAVTHFAAPGSPNGLVPPPTHSFAARAARALVVARAQATYLGPALLDWTAYTETGAGPTTAIVPVTAANTGTTYTSLVNSSHTGAGPAAYNAARGGWSVSAGGYARRYIECNSYVLRDRIAVIPVLVRVYGRTITAGTGTVRVQTGLHSYVDVSIAIGASGWHRAVGWLEVGISPEQPLVAQVFVSHVGASGSLEVEAVRVGWQIPPAT